MKLKYFLMGLGIGLIVSTVLFFVLKGSSKVEISDNDIMNRAKELGMVKLEDLPDKKIEKLKNEVMKPSSELKTEEIKSEKEIETKEVEVKEENKEDLLKENSQKKENEKKNNFEKTVSTGNTSTTEKVESKSKSEPTSNTERGKEEAAKNKKEELQADSEGKKTDSKNEASGSEPEKKEETPSKAVNTKKNQKQDEKKKTYTYTVIPGSSAVRLCNDLQAIGLIKDAKDFNYFLAVNNYATKIRNGTFTFTSGESYKSMAEKLVSRELNP